MFPLHCNNVSDKYITFCKRFGVYESEDKHISLYFLQAAFEEKWLICPAEDAVT